jgi:hypothetical protein
MDLLEPTDGRRHPWELRRAAFFGGVLGDALAGRRGLDVLDCGAGDAYFASTLKQAVPGVRSITCYDANYDAATLARLGGTYPSLAFSRSRPERPFDVVLMLDVLEHVEDDVAFLTGMVRDCVASDGLVLLSVPAWPLLFSRHDSFLGHHRRYTPAACDRVLETSGLEIVKRGGAFHSLVGPRAATALGEKLAGLRAPLPALEESTASWNHGVAMTSLVKGALRIDNLASRVFARAKVNVPGLTYWALARVRRG